MKTWFDMPTTQICILFQPSIESKLAENNTKLTEIRALEIKENWDPFKRGTKIQKKKWLPAKEVISLCYLEYPPNLCWKVKLVQH